MLTVNDISKSAEVTPDTVRHYVRVGLLRPKKNASNGYKEFTSEDIRTVRFVRLAKDLGFSLSDIKKIIHHSSRGESPCPTVRRLIQKRIEENRKKLDELIALQNRMELALKKWEKMPDGEPNGHAICQLIESVKDD